MSVQIVRSSKFRHIYGEEEKSQGQFLELRPYVSAWDSDFIKASSQYFAFPWNSGGGSVAALKYSQVGKQKTPPLLDAHSGKIQDLDFSPFNPYLLATGGMDCDVRVWNLPKDGVTQSMKESTVLLQGHDKKIGSLKFHPTAANTLVSVASDNLIKFWDVEAGKEKINVDCLSKHTPLSIEFNWNGSAMVTSNKDKFLRVIDPRNNKISMEAEAHQGTKSWRALWCGRLDKIVSIGSSKLSERQYMFWDPRKLEKPLVESIIDVQSGLVMPFFDEDTSILYLAGKGDTSIRYYELENESPYVHSIESFRATKPQIGMAMVPKYMVDTSVCEVARMLKLVVDAVIPIHFKVDRKSSHFQDDIFPDTKGPTAPLTSEEWFSGKDADPIVISLNPKKNSELKSLGVEVKEFSTSQVREVKIKLPDKVVDPKRLTEQNEQFRERIVKLENKVLQLEEKVREYRKLLKEAGRHDIVEEDENKPQDSTPVDTEPASEEKE
jgi:hypothetical protein